MFSEPFFFSSLRSPSEWKWILNSNWKHNHEHGRRGERKALPSRLGNMAEKEKSSNLLNRMLTGTVLEDMKFEWKFASSLHANWCFAIYEYWNIFYSSSKVDLFSTKGEIFKSKGFIFYVRERPKSDAYNNVIDLQCRDELGKFLLFSYMHNHLPGIASSTERRLTNSNFSSTQDNK